MSAENDDFEQADAEADATLKYALILKGCAMVTPKP